MYRKNKMIHNHGAKLVIIPEFTNLFCFFLQITPNQATTQSLAILFREGKKMRKAFWPIHIKLLPLHANCPVSKGVWESGQTQTHIQNVEFKRISK